MFAAESVRGAVESHVRGLKKTRIHVLPDDIFRGLSATEASQGVMALVRPPQWSVDQLFRGHSLTVALDGLQDPGNAGAVLRAAEAFGATGVAFLKGTVSPYNPKCLRASAGSIFRVPVVAALDQQLFLAAAEQRKIALFALMPKGTTDVGEVELGRQVRHYRRQRRTRRERTAARQGHGHPDSDRWRGVAQRGTGGRHCAVCRAEAKDGRR